jgi:dienelactone hydrolase
MAGPVLADQGTLTAEDLTVLDNPPKRMMRDYLTELVDAQFAQRATALAKLKTAEDWNRHARMIRESMSAWTGPFPERTPLNVRVLGTIERPECSVQKILFESRAGFLVSANLHLPKGYEGRRPAVLNVIGHSPSGKATDKVQRRGIAQARKGFVSLTIDAIGQGERQVSEYASVGRPPGNAHQIIGTQAFLAGTHVFNIMAWDVIRAVDYLVSRPDVDPERIACTGCSGGGMMTTYVLPFEPRIKVAVPACNPNTWSHRVHANLATDHEQVFFGAFAAGIDPRGDPLFCQVPKPLQINATSEDSLNPTSGVWELSEWLDKAYAAHGEPEKFETSMVDAPHGYNLEQRENAYAWMLRWLEGDAAENREGDFSVLDERETWSTPQGNVYADGQSRQPHALVLDHLHEHRPSWGPVKSEQALVEHKARLQSSVEKVLGLPHRIAVPEVTVQASRSCGGLKLTPIVLHPEKGIILPGLWIESASAATRGPVILYLHDSGKANLVKETILDRLVLTEGYRILAVDLRGMGETAPGEEAKFWDFLAGRPILAQRVADVRSILKWVSQSQAGDDGVHVWAQGISALCAVFAATLEDNVTGLVLEEPLLCFESIVTVKTPAYRQKIMVPGVLEQFDLPQVYQALTPTRVTLINPLRGDRVSASDEEAAEAYQPVAEAYESLQQHQRWRVLTDVDKQERPARLLSAFVGAAEGNDAPIFPKQGWEQATPDSQNVDPDKLQAAVDYLQEHAGSNGVKRLVIVRNGRMIWRGGEAETCQRVWSISKAFTSTAHGPR